MRFIEYDLFAEMLCMGEREKAGIFKPCCRTIRYSQITGALRHKFNNKNLHAVGYLVKENGFNQIDYLIYSPRNRFVKISKVPLQVEFLRNVKGKIFIPIVENEIATLLPSEFEILMGAMLSKGFGLCKLCKVKEFEPPKKLKRGFLNTRLPEKYKELFGIRNVIKPVYGYLFEPDEQNPLTGNYILSLFEGSEVIAPDFLIEDKKEEKNG